MFQVLGYITRDKLKLQLNIPGEDNLEVRGHVRWKSQKTGDFSKIGIQFEPFGRGKYLNPLASLEKLREIQQQYNLSIILRFSLFIRYKFQKIYNFFSVDKNIFSSQNLAVTPFFYYRLLAKTRQK